VLDLKLGDDGAHLFVKLALFKKVGVDGDGFNFFLEGGKFLDFSLNFFFDGWFIFKLLL